MLGRWRTGRGSTNVERVPDLDPALRHRVSQAPVARLATVRPDGHPHVVPITFAVDGERVVTAIDHKPKTTSSLQRLRNIRANPVASVLVDHYDDDWSRLWWVRADGVARVRDASPEALAALTAKYPQYAATPPPGPFLEITVRRWSAWAAS